MEIKISDGAIEWFQQEMEVSSGDSIRFYVRYGGSSKLQPGFSLGVSKDEPAEAAVETTHDDVMYFVEEKDVWYFDGHDLRVTVNNDLQELEYSYE